MSAGTLRSYEHSRCKKSKKAIIFSKALSAGKNLKLVMFDLLREDCPEQWEKKKEQTAATGIGCFSICERICTAKSKWQCRGPITTEYKALTDA